MKRVDARHFIDGHYWPRPFYEGHVINGFLYSGESRVCGYDKRIIQNSWVDIDELVEPVCKVKITLK